MEVLNKLKMTDSEPCSTPVFLKSAPSYFEPGKSFIGSYRELVNELFFLESATTRPDILYSVNSLTKIQTH